MQTARAGQHNRRLQIATDVTDIFCQYFKLLSFTHFKSSIILLPIFFTSFDSLYTDIEICIVIRDV